jgi:hypothetical protein
MPAIIKSYYKKSGKLYLYDGSLDKPEFRRGTVRPLRDGVTVVQSFINAPPYLNRVEESLRERFGITGT